MFINNSAAVPEVPDKHSGRLTGKQEGTGLLLFADHPGVIVSWLEFEMTSPRTPARSRII